MINSISKVKEIISRFRDAKIAVFGDLMLDVHISGKAERISQEAPVPVVTVKNHGVSLGGATNVIKNLATYDADTHAFGVIGDDVAGEEILRLLKKSGSSCDGVLRLKQRRTTRKERIIANSQQLIRIDYEDTSPIPDTVITPLLNRLIKMIGKKKLDAVIVEDYAKGLVSARSLKLISDECKKNNVICALDPHPSHPFDIKGITFMTPNYSEALSLAGLPHRNSDEPKEKQKYLREAAKKLINKWLPRELIITLGPDGMALFRGRNGKPHIIPTKAKEVFDVSGAGDTVIALYTLSIIAGATAEEAVEIANHAAGVVVGKIGTATASPEEIIESFKSEGLS